MSETKNSAHAPQSEAQAAETRAARIIRCLNEALSPQSLDVLDESYKHAGHSGWREEGETHYNVHIVAEAFSGKNRVERHRMINALLAPEFAAGLHALALTTLTPDEAARRTA